MKQYEKIKNVLLIGCLLITCKGFSQTDTSLVKFSNPASVAIPKGYSHAAVVDLGNCKMMILSGQVPLDRNGNLIGKYNLAIQTEQVFQNIKNILTEHGGTMNNLVKLGVYIVDMSQIQSFREVRNKFINVETPPASTLVQVSKLFRDDVLLEVEAMAIIPKK